MSELPRQHTAEQPEISHTYVVSQRCTDPSAPAESKLERLRRLYANAVMATSAAGVFIRASTRKEEILCITISPFSLPLATCDSTLATAVMGVTCDWARRESGGGKEKNKPTEWRTSTTNATMVKTKQHSP